MHDLKTKRTPVHAAAASGNEDCMQLLLNNCENKAVVDAIDSQKRYVNFFSLHLKRKIPFTKFNFLNLSTVIQGLP